MSRPATSFHRLSAVSSIGRSTPRYHSSPLGEREHSSVLERLQWWKLGMKLAVFAAFSSLHTTLHTCGRSRDGSSHLEALLACRSVDNFCDRRLSILARHGSSLGLFLLLSRSRETHLPAQRAPAEAQARISCAHGDACRPRNSQAPPRQGPEAPFRVTACATPEPPVSLARLRRRLPAGPLDLDAVPRPLLVRAWRGAR